MKCVKDSNNRLLPGLFLPSLDHSYPPLQLPRVYVSAKMIKIGPRNHNYGAVNGIIVTK